MNGMHRVRQPVREEKNYLLTILFSFSDSRIEYIIISVIKEMLFFDRKFEKKERSPFKKRLKLRCSLEDVPNALDFRNILKWLIIENPPYRYGERNFTKLVRSGAFKLLPWLRNWVKVYWGDLLCYLFQGKTTIHFIFFYIEITVTCFLKFKFISIKWYLWRIKCNFNWLQENHKK